MRVDRGKGKDKSIGGGQKGESAREMCLDDQISVRPTNRTHTIMWEADKQCNSKKRANVVVNF